MVCKIGAIFSNLDLIDIESRVTADSMYSFTEVADGQLFGLLIVFAAFDMISYLAYYIAINRLQPAKATGLNVSYVVWTVLFAVIFLGAPLDMLTIITSLIVMAGVYIIIKE